MEGEEVVRVPVACYALNSDAKAAVCNLFSQVKSPDGYLSNISRCVRDNGRKISCMKSHDHHVFLEQLLPLATRGFLPKNVYEPLVELSTFFRNLCAKNITLKQLEAMQKKIPYTLCKLEMVFPPAFFDVMVHLVVHLAEEAMIAGPVRYRWMYPVERYLRTLKRYVRNQAHPEGSMSEGYLADECLTFCSRYMEDIDTKFNRKARNDDEEDDGLSDEGKKKTELEIFEQLGHPLGKGMPLHLDFEECDRIHFYVLENCDELVDFAKEHKLELEQVNPRNVARRHKTEFSNWIRERVRKLPEKGTNYEDLYDLVCCPSRVVRRYSGYIVNGFRFHTRDRCENRKTQNSGVMVRGDEVSNQEYYGVLRDIFEVRYPGGKRVYLFKCDWYDIAHHGRGYKVDEYGLITVNKTKSLKTEEVYVLESQIEQVFYVQDPHNADWDFVLKTQPRDLYDMPSKQGGEDVLDVDADQQTEVDQQVEADGEDDNLRRVTDDFSSGCLATNDFQFVRESNLVDMVKDVIKQRDEDHGFINDDDNEVPDESSEEEIELLDYSSEEELEVLHNSSDNEEPIH